MTTFPLLAVPGIDRTSERFRRELVRGSLERGYDPNFIAAIISNESGFRPNVQNQLGAPALGLIQFWRDYFPAIASRAGMRVTWEDLRRLSATEQLPLVFAYFDGTKIRSLGSSATPTDYYMATFLPALVGAPSDRVLGQRDGEGPVEGTSLSLAKMYAQNPGFDHDGDGVFTVGDVGRKIESTLSAARGRPPVLVPLAVAFSGAGSSPAAPPTEPGESFRPDAGAVAAADPGREMEPSAEPSAASDDDLATLPPDYRLVSLPPLERGDAGVAVYLLQTLLGYLKRDSLFGPLTERRVRTFQEVAGIRSPTQSQSVRVCDATWALLAKHADRLTRHGGP